MLTNLALMFVLHIIGIGIFLGRSSDTLGWSKLAQVFVYLFGFYLFWGLVFAGFPSLIEPAL